MPEPFSLYSCGVTASSVVNKSYTRDWLDSPAASAGLTQSDVIVRYDGTSVDDYHHLQRLVAETDVGKRVALEIVRRRTKQTVYARIVEAPDQAARPR